jgi:uncharacterized protein (TIGR02145 family)
MKNSIKYKKKYHMTENFNSIRLYFYLIVISAFLILNSCKKESINNNEVEFMDEISKIVPSELIDQINIELNTRKSLPNYNIYIDSLQAATTRLIIRLEERNQVEDFKNQLSQIYVALNSSNRENNESIECILKRIGLGLGIGADLSYISSIEVGLAVLVGYEVERGGGVKIIYDYVNLERQIIYFSMCYMEDDEILGGGLGVALGSGVGFMGFTESIFGFRCGEHGIDEYSGPAAQEEYSVEVSVELGISLQGAYWTMKDDICSWDDCLLMECPDYFSSQATNLRGITVGRGGSADIGFALMVAIKDSKVGICNEIINGTYTNYLSNEFGRLFAATLMAGEMTIVGSPLNVAPVALSFFYGLFDPCTCPNNAPEVPSNPIPQNGAMDQEDFLTLSWNCADPDGDPLTYEVYFGPNGQVQFYDNTDQAYITVYNLESGTTYVWQINAIDDKNATTEGPPWHFKTAGEPNQSPTLPADPFPEDDAVGVSLNPILSWSCWEPDNDPLRFHIYFGTETDPGLEISNLGQFTYPLYSLLPGTKYYWKVVAEDDHNHFTTGPIWTFTTGQQGILNPCPGLPTIDYEGTTYNTVQIGSQCWLRENLNYQTTNSWCYDNNPSNCAQYGRLYDYSAALGACPEGWHLPSDDEWKALEVGLGMSQIDADLTGWRGTDQGTQLKAGGSSGFEALMGGTYNLGFFGDLGQGGYFWSSTEVTSTNAWARMLNLSNPEAGRYQSLRENGFSVRCLKND